MNGNPYQPPLPILAEETFPDSPRGLRYKHLRKEASIKFLGTLVLLGGIITGLVGSVILIAAGGVISHSRSNSGILELLGWPLLLMVAALLLVALASGLRRFRPWARVTTLIIACAGTIALPGLLLLCLHALITLLGKSASVVFSAEYQAVIAATPDLKDKTPVHTWIMIGIILLTFGGAMAWLRYAP